MIRQKSRWLYSFLHAIFLLLFTLFWRSQPTTFADETFLVDWSAIINKTVLKIQSNRPNSKEFIFINVADDKTAITDEFGARRVVTDRQRLGRLLHFINQYPEQYKYVLCDVLFEYQSDEDSLLSAEIKKMRRIIAPSSIVNDSAGKEKLLAPIFRVKSGLVDYNVTARKGVFSKYTLMERDSLKSLPLQMYEDLYQANFTKGTLAYWMNGHLSYNLIVPDLRIRNYDLFEENNYTEVKLFELLTLLEVNPDKFFEVYLKDRIIVIGDFDNDKARTAFGDLAGSLILVNVYLALVNQENLVSYMMLLLLLASYTLISYSLLYSFRTKENVWWFKIRKNRFVQFFDYLIALLLISFTTYTIAGVHINVGIIFVYLKAIDYVRNQAILEKTQKELLEAYKRSDELLLNILPKEVAEELKKQDKNSERKTIAKDYKLATVMFTDFKSFTDSASQMTPVELVKELDFYFSKFDEIIEKYRLEKIKTIGDAYMCAGGVPEANETNPMQAVLAALEITAMMQKIALEKSAKGQSFWQLRMGINSGELIAGVIGTNKFAYDIWGDAVNIASRMESNGEVGKINISSNTHKLIKDYFNCTYRGEISIKGKGKMEAYFVERIKLEYAEDEAGFFPNQKLLKMFEV